MQSHQIPLLGKEFRVRSEDEPEHLAEVARYVNAQFETMGASAAQTSNQSALLLASLNMASELFKERARTASLSEKLRARSKALLTRLGA